MTAHKEELQIKLIILLHLNQNVLIASITVIVIPFILVLTDLMTNRSTILPTASPMSWFKFNNFANDMISKVSFASKDNLV